MKSISSAGDSETVTRTKHRDGWDRVNFGRILHRLRTQAGLTQVELGERLGRDRRRIMVLEQGLAARPPGSTEIGLIAAALGGGTAAIELATAVFNVPSDLSADPSPRERVHRHLASDFSRLLSRVDNVRDDARSLARSVDQLFDEWLIPDRVVQRSHRAIASTVASVLEELHFDTELLRRHLAETTPALSARPWVDVIVDFRQRQSRYWSRCADVAWEIKDRGEPDQLERYLNVLELGTFHLHARVSQPANTALRAMGHLFLFWAELAMRVAADLQARPECASSRARVGERQSGVAFHRLLKALQTFDELPFVAFAEQLYYRDAPQTARYDMDQVLYLWGKLNEELPGLLPTDTTVEGLRWRCLVS